MSKFKKGYTPLEAALLAVGLEQYQEIPRNQLPFDYREHDSEPCELEKLATEAEEIQIALIDETILAYQALNGGENRTELSIYKECYTDETQEGIDLASTKLTKESLALWFTNIGDEDKAKRFVQPTSNKPLQNSINKFNKGFTAEHCALIATSLESYNDIDTAIKASDEQEEALKQQAIDAHRDYWYEVNSDPNLENEAALVARNLKEALCDEIEIAYEYQIYNQTAVEYAEIGVLQQPPSQVTDIEIYKLSLINNDKELDIENTKITKLSLAIWLWNNGHNEYAVNVLPNIQSSLQEIEQAKAKIQQKQWNPEQNTKVKERSIKATRTPERSLIDSLGIMAWLLSTKTNKLKLGDKPNSSQIKAAIEAVIIDLGLNENTDNKISYSNLDRDISAALKQLEGRFKL